MLFWGPVWEAAGCTIRLGPWGLSTRTPMKCREFVLSAKASPIMLSAPDEASGAPQREQDASVMTASQLLRNSRPKLLAPRTATRDRLKSAQRRIAMPLDL